MRHLKFMRPPFLIHAGPVTGLDHCVESLTAAGVPSVVMSCSSEEDGAIVGERLKSKPREVVFITKLTSLGLSGLRSVIGDGFLIPVSVFRGSAADIVEVSKHRGVGLSIGLAEKWLSIWKSQGGLCRIQLELQPGEFLSGIVNKESFSESQ